MRSANFRRWSTITACFMLAVIFLCIISPYPVQADVGVHPVLPGGSSIEPEADTPVQMASEKVVMNVRLATAEDNSILQLNPEAYGLNGQAVWYPAVAMVVADFTMHNPTDQPIELTTWFPLASALQTVSWELNPNETVPAIASFQATQDGKLLDFTVSQQPNPNGEDKPPLPWASFLVSYPPNADTHLQVSYLVPLTQAVKGSELALYYIFQTGAGWAGPIGQAELIVNLPYPASANTIVRISPEGLRIPYPMADPGAAIPSSAVMQGTQARWEWKDFEPTAQDDFAAWLVNPELWQQLQDAKTQEQVDPTNAPAQIDLGMVYYRLAVGAYSRPTIFNDRYRDPGIEAFTKASELWPENPIPHTAIALLTLSQYVPSGDAPPDVIQLVYDHLQVAKELEAEHPELIGNYAISSSMVDDVLAIYNTSKITATAEISASSTTQAKRAQAAVYTVTPTLTASPLPSFTPTSSPPPSPQPASPTPTVTPEPASAGFSGRGMAAIIILTVCSFTMVVVLVILGIAIVRRSPQGD